MNTAWTVLLGVVAIGIVAICVFRAVVSARTPQSAAGWVIFLLAAPWFGVPAYVFFGHHKLRDYSEARRRSRELRGPLNRQAQAYPPDEAARTRLLAFERLVQLPTVGGNGVELLIDGAATYQAMFEAIEAAQDYICLQSFTIIDDAVGQDFATRLIAAVARGVKVWVIYDGVGSYGLSRSYLRKLREAGIRILDPKETRGPRSRLQINFRNHRKTLIVDGRIGFVGGHNISETYLGRHPHYGHWRDTHLRITGPIVAQLQLAFVEDWHWATDENLSESLTWEPGKEEEGGMTALIAPMGPGDRMDTGALFFVSAISAARSRVWIASPYFVPDVDAISALISAALRGCDVRLLVPDIADHYLTWLAAFAFYDDIRAAGVRIYRYTNGFMHQKVVLVDDDLVAIGSANLDNRSFRLNFETMAVVSDPGLAETVEAMLSADLNCSFLLEKSLKEQPLKVRIGAPLARLLAPVL
ncbi:cardiolipin synthase [Pseudooceanicola sp.]|uniref:cardiolipin synthase n=1 Tax=Pseudooceanicola sp. TaxID=1914328 RepID=UPI003514A7A3